MILKIDVVIMVASEMSQIKAISNVFNKMEKDTSYEYEAIAKQLSTGQISYQSVLEYKRKLIDDDNLTEKREKFFDIIDKRIIKAITDKWQTV